MLGNKTLWTPSFGVFDAKTIVNEVPPFVESKIFTLVALMGALAVPATFHVTV